MYTINEKSLHSWAGDFVLYEEDTVAADETRADSTSIDDVNAYNKVEA